MSNIVPFQKNAWSVDGLRQPPESADWSAFGEGKWQATMACHDPIFGEHLVTYYWRTRSEVRAFLEAVAAAGQEEKLLGRMTHKQLRHVMRRTESGPALRRHHAYEKAVLRSLVEGV